ncbi:MAG: hypothetical protein AABM42_02305 [Actinomycetota bacterium]
MATLAMFAALGGGAYAAATIGADDIKKNAVRSKHIKRSAVKSADIKNGAVTRGEVLNGSLRAADVSVFRIDATVNLSIAAQTCINNDFGVDEIRPGDRALMFTKNLEADAQVQAKVFVDSQFATEAGRLPFRACNLGTAALTDETIPVNIIVIR